jgi:LacI family transcriptional regulator
MITIKEMANMLGLSTATVSNVIHGKTSEVSQETIEKVNKLLKEYEYVPNINARNLASNKSGLVVVGIISKENDSNYLKDAFVSELVGAIERELKKTGYFMMMYFAETAQEMIRTVTSWNVDGMILVGIRKEDCELFQKRYKKPKVYVDSYLNEMNFQGVNIGLDDRRGGYLMGRYLIGEGHRRMLFLADNFYGVDYERYCGFASAMTEAGITVSQNNFMRLGAGEEELKRSLEEVYDVREQYTVFFAASDYYALRIVNELWDRGVKVPEDISVVGFDDNNYSRMARPGITTVHQDPTQKGMLAVSYLMKQMKGKKMAGDEIVLPVELVIRGTVKKIN